MKFIAILSLSLILDGSEKHAMNRKKMTQTTYSCWYLIIVLALLAASGTIGGCAQSQDTDREVAVIREIEIERLRSLVDADMDVAGQLHADDFQLITPDGSEYTKHTYLGGIASGELDYLVWQPGEIRVKLYGDVAVIRYDDSQFEIAVNGELARTGMLRHINLYEKRNDQWQVVWSQASGGQVP